MFPYARRSSLSRSARARRSLVTAIFEQVRGAVEDGSTYPLFDDLTGDFVAEAIRCGLIRYSEGNAARGRHGGLSGDLLQRLPLFEKATLAEALGVRRELERLLRGFRVAVSDFSKQIRSAAWDPSIAEEADALFREKVQPEVERIEHAVRENRSLEELPRRVVRHGVPHATFGAVIGSGSSPHGASRLLQPFPAWAA